MFARMIRTKTGLQGTLGEGWVRGRQRGEVCWEKKLPSQLIALDSQMSYFYLSLFLVNLRSKIFQYPGTLKAYIYGMHHNGLQYSTWSHSLLMNNTHLMTGLRGAQ